MNLITIGVREKKKNETQYVLSRHIYPKAEPIDFITPFLLSIGVPYPTYKA